MSLHFFRSEEPLSASSRISTYGLESAILANRHFSDDYLSRDQGIYPIGWCRTERISVTSSIVSEHPQITRGTTQEFRRHGRRPWGWSKQARLRCSCLHFLYDPNFLVCYTDMPALQSRLWSSQKSRFLLCISVTSFFASKARFYNQTTINVGNILDHAQQIYKRSLNTPTVHFNGLFQDSCRRLRRLRCYLPLWFWCTVIVGYRSFPNWE